MYRGKSGLLLVDRSFFIKLSLSEEEEEEKEAFIVCNLYDEIFQKL